MKIYNVTRLRMPALILSILSIASFWIYTFFVSDGFNFGIDFSAGLVINVSIPEQSDEEQVRNSLSDLNYQVQRAGNANNQSDGRFVIRVADDNSTENFQQTTTKKVLDSLKENFSSVNLESEEYIKGSFAASLAVQTFWVTFIALLFILIYIWIRFKLNYAVSAIIAIFHDVIFLLGIIGALQLEFSTATVAAVLTIIGYSLNDTIVIFDRVRENARLIKDESFKHVINLSISQSLSRTLITSLTTLLAVVSILYFSQGAIQTFALSLVIGVLVGTYSSIFIASPVLLWWHDAHLQREIRKREVSQSHKEAPSLVKSSDSDSGKVVVQQSAEEIAKATKRRARVRSKKKKKKKGKA